MSAWVRAISASSQGHGRRCGGWPGWAARAAPRRLSGSAARRGPPAPTPADGRRRRAPTTPPAPATARSISETGPGFGHGQRSTRADGRAFLVTGRAGHDGAAGLDAGRPARHVDVAQRPGDTGQPEARVEPPPAVEDPGDADVEIARRGVEAGGEIELDSDLCLLHRRPCRKVELSQL